MNKFKAYLLTGILLVLSVPWWFSESSTEHIIGMPVWAFYSFVVSIVYAIVIAVCISVFWDDNDAGS